ncbi:acyl-CoA-like ligand-binding transcription factor [Amycolatopsis alkalitolerans]|uniref:TetR family transcriptional regulator n=1 Tax=Amycolatopsis alkalitolerans TaxID=2547244 RepID=A0A5C4LXQ7_9PSEU|nr:TetR family transcriptional regulator [Amycolatopsis alkalitolerans]TNC24381.1 TetR family transcriptional regulator [Amycolatopsis alkalitolerans]
MGLRERKKDQTRQALSDAALRLAVDRGLEHVLVEDIAAAADVSPRTFNNYFSSKQEAIVWRTAQRTAGAADRLRARPAGEPLWEAMTNAVLAPYLDAGAPSEPWLAGVRQLLKNPALQGEVLKSHHSAELELAAAVAERTGAGEHEMLPRLVAGAVGLAQRVATEHWLRADPPLPIETHLRRALAELRRGLTEEPS